MKKAVNIFNIVFTTAFILSVSFTLYKISALPVAVAQQLIASHVTLLVYLSFALGLIAIINSLVILNGRFSKEIIYVDRINQSENDKNAAGTREDDLSFLGNIKDDFEKILKSDHDLQTKFDRILSSVAGKMQAGQGMIFKAVDDEGRKKFRQFVSYAYVNEPHEQLEFENGEGLVGLAAKENKVMLVDNITESYLSLYSGLGKTSPVCVLIVPLADGSEVEGIMELALFNKPGKTESEFYNHLSAKLGEILSQEN
jgi:hypothetical protein